MMYDKDKMLMLVHVGETMSSVPENEKMLRAWYQARGVGKPLMRNKYAHKLTDRPDLVDLLDDYEEAHDEVTRKGAHFIRETAVLPVYH